MAWLKKGDIFLSEISEKELKKLYKRSIEYIRKNIRRISREPKLTFCAMDNKISAIHYLKTF